jgi:hypothetical protein
LQCGIVDHHCLKFLFLCWYWWNCWPSLFKLSFVLLILVNKRKFKQWWSTIPTISTKQRNLNSDGQQFHQYQQIEKSRKWWSTFPILVELSTITV